MISGLMERNNYISANAACVEGNTIVLSNLRGNGLFCIDLQEKNMIIEWFHSLPKWGQSLHSGMCQWKEYVYFFPGSCNVLTVYNMRTKEQKVIENENISSGEGVLVSDKVYIIPWYKNNTLISVDCKSNLVNKETWWDMNALDIDYRFLKSVKMDEERVAIVPVGSHCFLIADFNKQILTKYELPQEVVLWDAEYYDGYLWFTQFDTYCIGKYSLLTQECTFYTPNNTGGMEKNNITYKKILVLQEYLLLVSAELQGIYMYDKNLNELKCVEKFPENMRYSLKEWYVTWQIVEEKMFIFFALTNYIAVIDTNTLTIKFYNTEVVDNLQFNHYVCELCEEKCKHMNQNEVIYEGEWFDLTNVEDYIHLISAGVLEKTVKRN